MLVGNEKLTVHEKVLKMYKWFLFEYSVGNELANILFRPYISDSN